MDNAPFSNLQFFLVQVCVCLAQLKPIKAQNIVDLLVKQSFKEIRLKLKNANDYISHSTSNILIKINIFILELGQIYLSCLFFNDLFPFNFNFLFLALALVLILVLCIVLFCVLFLFLELCTYF